MVNLHNSIDLANYSDLHVYIVGVAYLHIIMNGHGMAHICI